MPKEIFSSQSAVFFAHKLVSSDICSLHFFLPSSMSLSLSFLQVFPVTYTLNSRKHLVHAPPSGNLGYILLYSLVCIYFYSSLIFSNCNPFNVQNHTSIYLLLLTHITNSFPQKFIICHGLGTSLAGAIRQIRYSFLQASSLR